MKITAWFSELDKNSIKVAGGKGANLGELTRAGLPVPPGFVVTAQAYEYFINETGIKDDINQILSKVDINNNDSLQKASKDIKEVIISETVPENIKKAVTEAYNNLLIGKKFEGLDGKALELVKANKNKEPLVAVRSSATAEDLPEASFAGQQETFLNVKGVESVLSSMKNCWASLFTPRAIFYREKNNFPHDKVLISVIVQKMVDSEKSGVSFSIHPASGNKNEIVIEAGWGLGEYIVKGVINPDYYVVDKETFQIKVKEVKKQTKMLTRDPLKDSNIEVEIPPAKQEKQVLDDEQVVTLARVMKKIEDHYDYAQDVEWASENNRLYIVQSRPVTFFGKEEEESGEESGEILIKGLSASPGKGTGKVVIIHDETELDKIKKGDILVTKMTDPDMVPAMERAGAIVTNEGGLTSHAAIVSRELGVPCIVGTGKATELLKEGSIVTVNGSKGVVTAGGTISDEPIETSKPVSIQKDYSAPVTATKVYMNLGIPKKILDYANLPVDGIGLMRVEFIIATYVKKHPLTMIKEGNSNVFVNKLAEGVAQVAGNINPRPVIVRFSDFKTNEYADLEGGEEFEPKENNPMLGWRGCSRYISEEFEQAFRLECRAIKKVRDSGLRNVWVMLPFVRNTWEVKKILDLMKSEGLLRSDDFKVLLMAEVPSIVFMAEEFSKLCDGFSIGSNDLTQLVLGVDRDSGKLGRMGYFNERNTAVKRAISELIRVAHENGVPVSICGQAPSQYPEFIDFLVEEGIDSISVNPDVVYDTREKVAAAERKILLGKARRGESIDYQEPQTITSNPTKSTNNYESSSEPESNQYESSYNSFTQEEDDDDEVSNDPRDHEEKDMFWP